MRPWCTSCRQTRQSAFFISDLSQFEEGVNEEAMGCVIWGSDPGAYKQRSALAT